jgi:small subunit ribosomal protein S6
MRDYEMMIIIDPDLDDETKRKTVEKIESIIKEKGGEVKERIDWGMRKFAYPVKKKEEGHYYILKFSTPGDAPLDIRKELRLVREIFRLMIIKEENVTSTRKRRA